MILQRIARHGKMELGRRNEVGHNQLAHIEEMEYFSLGVMIRGWIVKFNCQCTKCNMWSNENDKSFSMLWI